MEKEYTLNNSTNFIIVDDNGESLAIELLSPDGPNFPANITRQDFDDGINAGYIKLVLISATVLWQSNYGLMDSPEADEAWSTSVTGFSDNSIVITIAQKGADISKEFSDIDTTIDWLRDFVGDRHLECDSDFDFRYDQAPARL